MPKQIDKKIWAEQLLAAFDGNIDAAIDALRQAEPTIKQARRPKAAPTGPVLVSVENLSKKYKVGRQHVQALNSVSLDIHEGEFVAFTGPSGSGKSTLLQLIGGLDKPSEGTITVEGHDLTKLNDRNLSRFRNKTIGFVFQFFYLQPFLRLQTNLEVPAIFARTKSKDRAGHAKELAQ